MHEARFWHQLDDNQVQCHLCRFFCRIPAGGRGRCGVRENREGRLWSLIYGHCAAENIDPVEKKPLYHWHPGSVSYSIATVGCNFRCLHCQNYQISQRPFPAGAFDGPETPPAAIVQRARASGCRSIAYTYTEPTIFLEYALDIAAPARAAGLGNLLVTNGYTSEEALRAAAPLIDAANVDLKGFSEGFYRKVTGASLAGVLDTLRLYRQLGIWLEVTTLVIPGHNDDPAELRDLARFIVSELGPDTPWHLSAFFPTYRLTDAPPTPLATLIAARDIGLQEGLRFVYLGNVAGSVGRDTLCPACGEVLIARAGFHSRVRGLTANRCSACGETVAGVFA